MAPVTKEYDAILPRWLLAKHKCDLLANDNRIKFDTEYCLKNCTNSNHENFSLKWDPEVLTDKNAGILGIVAAAPTENDLQAAISRVPEAFQHFIPIMTTEAALELPNHGPYDHAIDLKEGETPPWGPIYALNEVELEQLRNWLKKITDMGAVREFKSSCSLPMLFVPKGHRSGLRLCIDYRGINKLTVPNRYPLPNMNELKDCV